MALSNFAAVKTAAPRPAAATSPTLPAVEPNVDRPARIFAPFLSSAVSFVPSSAVFLPAVAKPALRLVKFPMKLYTTERSGILSHLFHDSGYLVQMSMKVKRGLGLLVVALIGWLVALALSQIETDGTFEALLLLIPTLVAGVALIGGLVGGLALIAWGLLRD